jgi:hypothetical protein
MARMSRASEAIMVLDLIPGIRSYAFAALALGPLVGAALAQSFPGAVDPTSSEAGNVVGGGGATLSGGGDDVTVIYNRGAGGGGGAMSQAGRTAHFGSTMGEGPVVEYDAPAPAGPGREAWLTGGGEGVAVVYTRPR